MTRHTQLHWLSNLHAATINIAKISRSIQCNASGVLMCTDWWKKWWEKQWMKLLKTGSHHSRFPKPWQSLQTCNEIFYWHLSANMPLWTSNGLRHLHGNSTLRTACEYTCSMAVFIAQWHSRQSTDKGTSKLLQNAEKFLLFLAFQKHKTTKLQSNS